MPFSLAQRLPPVFCGSLLLSLALTACSTARAPLVQERTATELPTGTPSATDQVDVYGSTKLGRHLSEFPGLTQVEKIGSWQTFTRPSDPLKFQRAELNGVSYHFFSGQFYSIHIEVLGKANANRLIAWTESTYGPNFDSKIKTFGPKLNRLIAREWRGNRVDVVLKFAEDLAGGTLIYVDRAMWLKLNKPRLDRATGAMQSFEGSWTNVDFD